MKDLDDIDYAIIKILQKDCKTSYRDINEMIGLSIGTIHNRISRLVKEGIIIQNTIILDEKRLGYAITSLINITIDSSKIQQTLTELSIDSNICSLFQVTGKHSATLIAKFRNTDDMYHFINSLNSDPSILSLQSEIVLNQLKFSPNIKFNGVIKK